jgi:CheY-like chemotaxis protein
MSNFFAILVEDEPTAAAEAREALEAAGFSVKEYSDASSALSGATTDGTPTDLLVLDRRLPLRHGELASDEVGDDLLEAMLQRYPDLVVIVFSGHTGFSHAQFATAKRGSLSLRQNDIQLDRVSIFEKSQTLEFDKHVRELYLCLSQIEDIQLELDPERSANNIDHITKRILRRVGYEYSGTSVQARPLTGGLTGSPVWLCNVHGMNGPIARVVIKRQNNKPRQGGFQSLLPAHLTAGTVSIVHGFCGGFYASVQQVAGAEPVPLLDLITSAPDSAAQIFRSLCDGLSTIKSGHVVTRPISEIGAAFEEWESVRARAARYGLEVPPGSRIASTVVAPQHGDLHPGNVLSVGDTPVVIDFDSQSDGSELVDAITLLLGPVFHRDSPLRDCDWPSVEQCSDLLGSNFLDGCPSENYFRAAIDWLLERKKSERELYSLLLAYSVRQLKYDDVSTDEKVRGRAVALARWATTQLVKT